ncbi:MAG: phosphatase PAP2 family protein [Bacteroidota bacterium]|nr:phosphatase PAP2 family protein [Bacteroidota bacterium]
MSHKCFLLFAGFFFLVSNLSIGQNIDINLLRDINLNRNESFDGVFKLLTNTAAPISAGIPVGMLGVGLIKGDSALTRHAIVIGASVVSSAMITLAMKAIVKRPRPFTTYSDIEKLTSGGGYSFPSGHTSGAFSLATSLSLDYPKWYVIIPSYVWASAVGYSRMDLGVHYPSDILMGAVVGAGSAYLCHYLNQKLFRHRMPLH